ncbi:MAG: PGF-pre-PGF domain-containing protein, partial [Candidatus Nanohaloarchaea archaeon]
SIIEATSNISGPYNLQFEVSDDWLEENRFEASEVSLYIREEDQWADQEAQLLDELPERSVYEVQVQGLSEFSIGVNRACYSTENVTAETEDSCRVYSNPCQVPSEAEEVESCQQHDERKEVEKQIEEKRQQVKSQEKVAKLTQAETLVAQGNISQARQIVQNVSPDTEREVPEIPIMAVIGAIILVTGGIGSYIFIIRRRTRSMNVETGELIDMLEELKKQGHDVKIPAMKLQKANTALKNGNYQKAEELTSEVKDYLETEL